LCKRQTLVKALATVASSSQQQTYRYLSSTDAWLRHR